MTHSLGSTVLKEGCVYNARTLHTHIWCWNGFPWTELGFLFYNCLLSIGSSCNGIITQSHSSKNKLRKKNILGPMSCKIWRVEMKARGWQAGDFSRGLCLVVCVLQTPVGVRWADHTCSISSPETAIFSLCPQYVQMLSQIHDIFNLFVFLLHSQ